LRLTRAADISAMEISLGAALAENPWIERWPAAVGPVTLVHTQERWWLMDAAGRRLPVAPRFKHAWSLLALSGGDAFDVFGEWDGFDFDPISVGFGGMLYSFAEIESFTVLAQAV
jgi:hypothetical protein